MAQLRPVKLARLRKSFAMLGIAVTALCFTLPAHAKPPSAAACVAAHRAVTEPGGEAIAAAPLDEVAVKAKAAAEFTQCATQLFGPAATPRAAECEPDLYTLPVLLLYRADGQNRAQAEADLARPGNEDGSPAAARRTVAMLAFVYQGPGPAGEGATAWIAKRTDDWTAQCLAGQR